MFLRFTMIKSRYVLLSFLFILLLNPVSAFMLFDSGNNLIISENEIIEGDLYAAGNSIIIEGVINGDLIVGANIIEIKGIINGDLIAGGNIITITGNVTDDVRIAGNTIILSGYVGSDFLSASNIINLNPESVINGDLVVGASDLTISGLIYGNVNSSVSSLIINQNASIHGNIQYSSEQEAVINTNDIRGEIIKKESQTTSKTGFDSFFNFIMWMNFIISILSTLLIGIVLLKINPKMIQDFQKRISKNYSKNFIYGISGLIIIPVIGIIFTATIIGLPLGLIILAIYGIIIYLALYPFLAFWIGKATLNALNFKINLSTALLIGILVIEAVSLIPFFGMIIRVILSIFSLGVLFQVMIDYYNKLKKN